MEFYFIKSIESQDIQLNTILPPSLQRMSPKTTLN